MPTSLQVIINIMFMKQQLQTFRAFTGLMAEFTNRENPLVCHIEQGLGTDRSRNCNQRHTVSQHYCSGFTTLEFQQNGVCLCYHFYHQKIEVKL